MILVFNTLGHDGNIAQELFKCFAPITIISVQTTQSGSNRHMSFGITTGIEGSHIIVHELELIGAIVGSIAGECDFESSHGFELNFRIKLLSSAVNSR